MRRFAILDEIRALDPVADHQRIVFLSTCYEFPFDTTRSLEFALFRTFAVPGISALLDQTGEFQRRPQKRYDDTDILVSTLLEHGYDSEAGKAALRRINQLHDRYDIANDDYLYVLSTFVYEPIRWNARFGWRPMCDQERQALFYFWREVGRRMNIRQLPDDYEAFERFNRDYEHSQFRFTESNRRVGAATRELFLGWVLPRWLRPLGRPAIHALLDEPLLTAFGFPRPSPFLRVLVNGLLRLRGRGVRWLPPRRRPRLRTAMKRRLYPHGYLLQTLGPDTT